MQVIIRKKVLNSNDAYSVDSYEKSGFYRVKFENTTEDIIFFVSKAVRSVIYVTQSEFLLRDLDEIVDNEKEKEPKKNELTEAFTLEIVRLLTREKDQKN